MVKKNTNKLTFAYKKKKKNEIKKHKIEAKTQSLTLLLLRTRQWPTSEPVFHEMRYASFSIVPFNPIQLKDV
jgi:hypothetical protein